MNDQRSKLDEEQFTYKILKNNSVFIYWHGKHITTLKGYDASEFIAGVAGADPHEAQYIMATVTGNFKRGNERQAKNKRKNR